MGTNLKHRRGPLDVTGAVPESRIEESRVMNSELAIRGIERYHLGCELRGNAHLLFGRKYVEVAGFENQILTRILMTNFPEFFRRIEINLVQFDGGGKALRLVGHDLRLCAFQIHSNSQPPLDSRLGGSVFVVDKRFFPIQSSDRAVARARIALNKPQLAQPHPCANRNRKRTGTKL